MSEDLRKIIEIAREKNEAITIEFQNERIARVIVHSLGGKKVKLAVDAEKDINIEVKND